MRILLAFAAALAASGCAGGSSAGVASLSVVDPLGRSQASFNYVFLDANGKVAWSGVPSQGTTVGNPMKGGVYDLLVIGGNGAARMTVEVDGDSRFLARLGSGGAVRGEARAAQKPLSGAQIWMPIPGRGSDPLDRFSNVVRADADGRFQIDRLPPGKWTLVIGSREEGFREVTATVVDGKVAELGIVEVR